MGMYLTIRRLINNKTCPMTEDAEKEVDFNCGKYVDDSKFATISRVHLDYKYIYCKTYGCCGATYFRPKSFNKAISWVRNMIPNRRGKKLVRVLEIMRKDDELYFEYS